ncbi:olfactory receptor 1019-like [Spea bombifrons]|uniref:olfactory receptor 1019-like n=1 Tax=Spea bombifrons TaxID=233779 RepID=UPI00234A1DD9|nr:olfactory receptor 1019-like [Spea bombifrons]
MKMILENKKNETVFSIQGLTDIPELQFPTFLIFLLCYIIIFWGNITIFLAILSDSHLHTPMYIFLLNLSLLDISNTSNILPKILNVLLTQHKFISFLGCMSQMYFFLSLTLSEVLLLAAMAYDRYVAICHPLHYFYLMSLRHTFALATSSWGIGFLDAIGHAVSVSNLCFCASHLIDHIFCDMTPLLKISCSDTFKVEMLTFVEGAILPIPAFLLTLISYVFIISTILQIRSAEGRQKAFSTCTSHLTCVTIFYGTITCMYMRPTTSYFPKQDKFFALLFIVLIPMLNPVIYSLKNQDVKSALKKMKKKIMC